MPEWRSVSETAKDLVTKLLHPDPKKRLNADEALAHEWIALKGCIGEGGDLKVAQAALKQQVAQKRLTAMWHVLDIINALDGSMGSTQPGTPAGRKQLPPGLLKRVSQSPEGSNRMLTPAEGGPSRPRLNSTTDRMEELQTLFNLFDTDGNGTIDQHEIAALFHKLGFDPNPTKLRALIDQVDSNHNGELEFSEFCEFLRLAKRPNEGIGLASSLQDSLSSLTDENGVISNDDLGRFLQTFAESTGQTISQSEIQDVIALAEDPQVEGGMRPADIAQAMLLDPAGRKKAAEMRKRTATSGGG